MESVMNLLNSFKLAVSASHRFPDFSVLEATIAESLSPVLRAGARHSSQRLTTSGEAGGWSPKRSRQPALGRPTSLRKRPVMMTASAL